MPAATARMMYNVVLDIPRPSKTTITEQRRCNQRPTSADGDREDTEIDRAVTFGW